MTKKPTLLELNFKAEGGSLKRSLGMVRSAFLPSVRTGFNHFTASRLHDSLMLMLAYGRNAIQTVFSYLRAYVEDPALDGAFGSTSNKKLFYCQL